MQIAISCRSMMGKKPTGIGRYTNQLIHHLGLVDSTNTYWLYARKSFFDRKRSLPSVSHPNMRVKPDYLNLGPARIVAGCDLFHSPSPEDVSQVPGKVIVTIHDLIYATYPQSHTPETIAITSKNMEMIVRRADKLICISQSTRDDLHKYFNIAQDKTAVVYNGVNHQFFYPLSSADKDQARQWIKSKGIEGKFALCVGTLEPRKNLLGICQAMAELKGKGKLNFKLAVAGMQGWLSTNTRDIIGTLGLLDDIVFLGFVSDEELAGLYNCATVFVFPSFYEGFGFPILEAMACGCPVITSHHSSCGELAQDAAITIDPKNTTAMAEAMASLMNDADLRQRYMTAGLTRAGEFSFEKTARETVAIYEQVYKG